MASTGLLAPVILGLAGLELFECSCEHRNELPVYIKGGKFLIVE
jgi:hypothetical protein